MEHDTPTTRLSSKSDSDRSSVELAARRTGMSFQPTRMSADRSLMSVIRTSLSLIGFGFTIYQVFAKLYEAVVTEERRAGRRVGEMAGRNEGRITPLSRLSASRLSARSCR